MQRHQLPRAIGRERPGGARCHYGQNPQRPAKPPVAARRPARFAFPERDIAVAHGAAAWRVSRRGATLLRLRRFAAAFPLAGPGDPAPSTGMSIEFGWWNKDAEGRKYQVNVAVHGGNIAWRRHQGHHTPWEDHVPDDDDRARLIYEAEKRVPRRLISQKQFDEIKRLSANEGAGAISGRRYRPSPDL
jgi:hypothetical protein